MPARKSRVIRRLRRKRRCGSKKIRKKAEKELAGQRQGERRSGAQAKKRAKTACDL